MNSKRTDLAVESHELWRESAQNTTKLEGVEASDYQKNGFTVNKVHILDERGSQALNKPVGTYITIGLEGLARKEGDYLTRASRVIADELLPLLGLKPETTVLVSGLGNWEVTPDSIGPKTLEHVMVTRHLTEKLPDLFGSFRKVAAISPGVLGTTGLETAEILRGVSQRSNPDLIIIIDALASRKLSRVCATVQIADTGIVPGSGVGNSRAAINKETMGVPVIAMGVPTVVDAATLAADLLEQAGKPNISPEELSPHGGGLIVTPKDIDQQIADIAKILGYGINLALHKDITVEDINTFLS
jgi:spore protease